MPLAESIWALFMRSWFYILWTVREIYLACHTEFVCGLETLDGDISRFALSMMQGKFRLTLISKETTVVLQDLEWFSDRSNRQKVRNLVCLLHSFSGPERKFSVDMERIWVGRSFFTTTKGRIWFASENVKVGDLICMFCSGPSVYLLREVSGADTLLFNFVSDGYTHSLMVGSVAIWVRWPQVKWSKGAKIELV
jgi:hypothetical protein